MELYIQWIFENEEVAREAITRAYEDGDVASSFGKGDKQYEGFDFSEGEVKYIKHKIGDKVFCQVDWTTKIDEDIDKTYWFSPHCFEDFDTIGLDGTSLRGEEFNFGLRNN